MDACDPSLVRSTACDPSLVVSAASASSLGLLPTSSCRCPCASMYTSDMIDLPAEAQPHGGSTSRSYRKLHGLDRASWRRNRDPRTAPKHCCPLLSTDPLGLTLAVVWIYSTTALHSTAAAPSLNSNPSSWSLSSLHPHLPFSDLQQMLVVVSHAPTSGSTLYSCSAVHEMMSSQHFGVRSCSMVPAGGPGAPTGRVSGTGGVGSGGALGQVLGGCLFKKARKTPYVV